jgi:hypothetical protein
MLLKTSHLILLVSTINFPFVLYFLNINEELASQLFVSLFFLPVIIYNIIKSPSPSWFTFSTFVCLLLFALLLIYNVFEFKYALLDYKQRYNAEISMFVSALLTSVYYVYIKTCPEAARKLFFKLFLLAMVSSTFIVATYLILFGMKMRAQSFYAAAVLSPVAILLTTNFLYPKLFHFALVPVVLSGSARSLVFFVYKYLLSPRLLLKKHIIYLLILALLVMLIAAINFNGVGLRTPASVVKSIGERIDLVNSGGELEFVLFNFDLDHYGTQRYHVNSLYSNPHSTFMFISGTFGLICALLFGLFLMLRSFHTSTWLKRTILLIIYMTETTIFRTPFISAIILYTSLNNT